jgi:outer membrane lipoprotein SlyB
MRGGIQAVILNKEIDMQIEKFKLVLPGVLALALAACGTQSPMTSSYPSTPTSTAQTATNSSATGYGVVQSVNLVQQQQRPGIGLGSIAGAVVGGVLGNQVGSGSGRTAATIAGAAGGGLVGHQMEGNMAAANQAYQVTVRMDNGSIQTLTQEAQPNVQIGERVRLADGVIVERFR